MLWFWTSASSFSLPCGFSEEEGSTYTSDKEQDCDLEVKCPVCGEIKGFGGYGKWCQFRREWGFGAEPSWTNIRVNQHWTKI